MKKGLLFKELIRGRLLSKFLALNFLLARSLFVDGYLSQSFPSLKPPVGLKTFRRQKHHLKLLQASNSRSENETTSLASTSPSSSVTSDLTEFEHSASLSKSSSPTVSIPKSFNRTLGSQELLMLPRQYKLGDAKFPQMNHVSCYVLKVDGPLNVNALRQAIDAAVAAHPLLSSRVIGDGEPVRRIDTLNMVRCWTEPEPHPLLFVSGSPFTSNDILTVVETEDVETSWREAFLRDLDSGDWCDVSSGPLWKIELHTEPFKRISEKHQTINAAMLFTFNHAISDQNSANRLMDQILRHMVELEETGSIVPAVVQYMPVTVEESVLGIGRRWKDVQGGGVSPSTIKYVAGKAMEGLKSPVILPERSSNFERNDALGALTIISGRTAGGQDSESSQRKSTVQFRSLSNESTDALLIRCRANGVSISNALTAAVTLTATDFIGSADSTVSPKMRNYKVLQSLDMRRFGSKIDEGETVACMAGSHDLIHGPLPDFAGAAIRKNPSERRLEKFWKLAMEGKTQTEAFVESDGPSEAVRVFDFAMTVSDLNNLVYLSGQSKDTKGRAYSAGATNAGVYEKQPGFVFEGESSRTQLQIQRGRYKMYDVHYATSHVTSGCLFQVSALTVNGQLKLTFHPVEPIVDRESNSLFADAFVDLLEKVSGKTEPHLDSQKDILQNLLHAIPSATAVLGSTCVLSHAGAWVNFFSSVLEMKANIANPTDFWAALNFWIFFAVGHPILQPILWISDVLHGSPGPMIGNLVPASFVVGNVIAIAVFALSKEIRHAVNIAAFAAFLTYVGAGLDGTAGLGDFNLALDDSYKGQVVKGCPAYEDVRQESMNDFDIQKYQGLWYEQKFHDWTQFKEVYDTTLDIRLTDGGLGWIDDFAVKGPAPDSAPLSWDKSPVANGAHYFLFGRVDPSDPKGILRESGFGVEFPNYIVDVKKDPVSGEYSEAIQFQCLERGGVRVFEGINFMSRNPAMSVSEMEDMHARAERAGMYPFGASPDQMHSVARRPVNAPEIDNNWQAMWRAIGLDKLLELLTESIEDGGR